MPPRFAYWTILAGGLPTSFRAADKDELMPTFRRLKEKHPDAEMKYFARGKLWESPAEARQALQHPKRDVNRPGSGRPGSGGLGGGRYGGERRPADREQRGRDWRPGGEHRDPRQRFKDAKKARNQDRRDERWHRKHDERSAEPPKVRPHGDPLAPRPDRRAGVKGSRQGQTDRPFTKLKPFGAPRPKSSGGARGGASERARGGAREFQPAARRRFERRHDAPPNPPRPDREPPPGREPKPEPPPRPSEPAIKPPGPPERGAPPHAEGGRRRRDREE